MKKTPNRAQPAGPDPFGKALTRWALTTAGKRAVKEDLQLAQAGGRIADRLAKINSGIDTTKLGFSAPNAPRVASPRPPAPADAPGLPAGQKVVVTHHDLLTPLGKWFYFGEFLALSNHIVTVRLTNGKIHYFFNTDRYKCVVKPVRAFPTFTVLV